MTARTHLEAALQEMQLVIDRARIRDSASVQAHKMALAVALIAPDVLADPNIDDDHKATIRQILGECRAIAVGGRPDLQPETLLDGIPIDQVLASVRQEAQHEIDAQKEWA